VGRATFPGNKLSPLALDTVRNVFYSKELEVQDTRTAGTIHIRLLGKLLSKRKSSGLWYDIAPPKKGPSCSQAPDGLFLSSLTCVR